MQQNSLLFFQPENQMKNNQNSLLSFQPSDAMVAPTRQGFRSLLSRMDQRDKQGTDVFPALAIGSGFAPSAGISDVLGFAPDPFNKGQTLPSFSENIDQGRYLDAGLQTLGAGGDLLLASAPFAPFLLAPAVAMKATSQLGKALRGGSRATKTVDDVKQGDIAKVVPPTDRSDGIFAFHGSGADFDEFKLSKIGTGEGNQVFGYGLYFTDSKDIAKFYKNATLKSQNVEFNGKPIKFLSDSQDIDNKTVILGKIRDRILSGNFNPKGAVNNVKFEYEQSIKNSFDLSKPLNKIEKMNYDSMKSDLDYIDSLDANDFKYQSGKTYEVNIKTVTDNLINNDIPINEQSKNMQDKVQEIIEIMPFAENKFFKLDLNLNGGLFRQELEGQVRAGINKIADNNVRRLKKEISQFDFEKMINEDPFLKLVNSKMLDDKTVTGYIGNPLGSTPKIASEIMNDFGIKGIKYKSGQLTRGQQDSKATNFVIFDDKIIDIMAKYGIVGAIGVSAMQRGSGSEGYILPNSAT